MNSLKKAVDNAQDLANKTGCRTVVERTEDGLQVSAIADWKAVSILTIAICRPAVK